MKIIRKLEDLTNDFIKSTNPEYKKKKKMEEKERRYSFLDKPKKEEINPNVAKSGRVVMGSRNKSQIYKSEELKHLKLIEKNEKNTEENTNFEIDTTNSDRLESSEDDYSARERGDSFGEENSYPRPIRPVPQPKLPNTHRENTSEEEKTLLLQGTLAFI